MASCDINPRIINKNGDEAVSKLWGDLHKIKNNREWVKRVYEGTHTDYFVSWFGDWIDNPDNASLIVDSNGEPKIVYVKVPYSDEPYPAFMKVKNKDRAEEVLNSKEAINVGADTSRDSYKIIWDEKGGEVDITEQNAVHPDPKIQRNIEEYGAVAITEGNNQFVWDKQSELGLVPNDPWRTDTYGNKYRLLNSFPLKKAKRLVKQATEDGFIATLEQDTRTGQRNRYFVILSKDVSQRTSASNRITARFEKYGETMGELRKRFPTVFDEMDKLSELEDLHRKVTESFQRRMGIMEKQYNFVERQGFKEFLDAYMESNNVSAALVSAVRYSAQVTKRLFDRYKSMLESNEPLTVKVLQTWSDFLIVYDMMDELQNFMVKNPSVIQNKALKETLRDAIEKKNFMKSLYQTEGIKLMAHWLAPFYGGINNKFELEAIAEYKRAYHRKKKGKEYKKEVEGKTQAEYVEGELKKNKYKIEQQTEELMLKELSKAGRDISELSRWLDNMLDTADPVAAAVVNAFVKAEEESRIQSIKQRTKMLSLLTNLEKVRKKRAFTSDIEFYRFVLEFDANGIPTQWLLKPWKSTLIAAEREMYERIYKRGEFENPDEVEAWRIDLKAGNLTREEFNRKRRKSMHEHREAWSQSEIRIDADLRDEGVLKYLKEFINKKDPESGEILINEHEYDVIKFSVIIQGTPTYTLVEEGDLRPEVANMYSDWINANKWKYSDVAPQWRNPQWDSFMKSVGIDPNLKYYQQLEELEESDNPLAKFYLEITDIADEADSKVPYSYRLGGRLPGVAKVLSERLKQGQDPMTIAKNTMQANFLIRPEDIERGDEILTDEQGNPKFFLPIHYANNIELKNQSFDLVGIYFRYWEAANDYTIKRQILPEIEMAKSFIDTRPVNKRNSLGDIVYSKLGLRGKGDVDPLDDTKLQPSVEQKTQLAKQFEDWFQMAVYGKRSKPGSIWHITDNFVLDGAKFVDAINQYTSLSLLAFNFVQGGANILIGETMEAIDAFAGEHVTIKSLTKASGRYTRWLPGMMGDWGMRAPTHVGSLLIERFGILHDDIADVNFSKKTKVGQAFDLGTLYVMQRAGEHWMQSRFLYAMLLEKKAYNTAGEEIGNMLDQYYSKNGELRIKKEVDLKKSKWTKVDQFAFSRKVKGLLSRMHGEYSDLGRIAIQRLAIGRMAYMFRKFVVPGFKRRWAKSKYIQRLGQTVEGNYQTTFRFIGNLLTELKIFKLSLMSEEWTALNDHEIANIRRMLGEVVAFLGTVILIHFFAKGLEDDDEENWRFAYFAYQAYRLQTELLFWTPKLDEAMTILRSPMASMSVFENMIKLIDQMFSAAERYERGPWKGEYKIKKTMINFVPLWKQYYKARDVKEQIRWFM
jgi:hypothetical protein